MARKASKRAAKSKGRTNGAVRPELAVKIAMDLPDEASTYYINHAELGHTKHEFSLTVGRFPPKVTPMAAQIARETGEFKISPALQLLFPPTLLPDLIRILTDQREKYEAKFGPINDADGDDKSKGDEK